MTSMRGFLGMKISIAWVFDHIDADWKKLDIAHLAEQFIQTIAEIDRVYKIEIDTRNLTCAQVVTISDQITLHSSELNKDFVLPARPDAHQGAWFLISSGPEVRWATLADLASGKDGLVPSLNSSGQAAEGNFSLTDDSWKTALQAPDYIFEIDNKSINHRPDLWGHRGVAREMAAMLGLKLKPLDPMLVPVEVIQYGNSAPATQDQPISITLKEPEKCFRFGAWYVRNVENRPSDLFMAARLARVDGRPIDAIVDATNYAMFDVGHPMHAFDAQAFGSKSIEVRDAKKGEKLRLLDGEELTLTPDDLIVAVGPTKLAEPEGPDKRRGVALTGIMGGLATAVTNKTTELLLEAACFDAAMIRTTAERAKKRTEASTRFEKKLDPNNNLNVLRRFAQLLDDMKVPHTMGTTLSSLGKPAVSPVIKVEHAYIESRLGVTIAPAAVIELLQRIDFGVLKSDVVYEITVPTFRATKDIQGKQDIVEEIGRLFGYKNITPVLPKLSLKPADLHAYTQLNKIKDTCAFVGNMREVATYNFFDETFIQSLGWEPGETLTVRSPVSQNWQRLVTTLVPNLLKGIQENCADYDQLRFFELAKVYAPGKEIAESKHLAGILFEKKKDLTFYDGKALLHDLFERLALPVTWHTHSGTSEPWMAPYQTADIKHGDTVIGIAGMMPQSFLHKMSEGRAFVFELDADFLLAYRAPIDRFASLPKFQPNVRDISILLPASETVAAIAKSIAHADPRIHNVVLIDYLEKVPVKSGLTPEVARSEGGEGKRGATFRFIIRQDEKTFTKPEIDAIVQSVSEAVAARGATIR
jgi:phenylalanyl-tRNA synthetase beta chain